MHQLGNPAVRRCAIAGVLAALAACARQGIPYAPVAVPGAHALRGASGLLVSITVTAPLKPAARSLRFLITGAGQPNARAIVDVGAAAADCSRSSTALACTAVLHAMPGTRTVTVQTFSNAGATGRTLSNDQILMEAVAPRATRWAFALGGTPASLATYALSSNVQRTGRAAFALQTGGAWSAPLAFTAVANDRSGAAIVGPTAPTISVVSRRAGFSIARPSSGAASVFTVTPAAHALEAATTLLEAAGAAKAEVSLAYAPFSRDDWIAFSHGFSRNALQSQPTGIGSENAGDLKLRWKANAGDQILAGPLAYAGNVIVVTYRGIVADYSASDGSVIWKRRLPDPLLRNPKGYNTVVSTPTIDAASGLLFLGDRDYHPDKNGPFGLQLGPSRYYALHVTDGSIAWQRDIPLTVRVGPAIVGATIYQGMAGGDPPFCDNGGVIAMDARTGATRWTWYVNPSTDPGGGGAVWSPVGYDGRHLVFGTGNACKDDLGTAQGAVALNLDGSMAWSFSAEANDAADDDTGGAVAVVGNTATFINKDGALYRLDAVTGVRQWATPLGAADSFGGFASPGSNGSVSVVGAGYLKTSAAVPAIDACPLPASRSARHSRVPGYASALRAVDSAGNVLWSQPSSSILTGWTAIAGDVAFASLDDRTVALDLNSGRELWKVAAASGAEFYGGPAVVPSGVYAADTAGNVYAASLKP